MADGIKWTYVFYESGLSVNVMYSINDPKKRAVGFKLSEGMEVPEELEEKFKFAKQKSKLAGIIRIIFCNQGGILRLLNYYALDGSLICRTYCLISRTGSHPHFFTYCPRPVRELFSL